MDDLRPDPDRLLAALQADEQRAARGKLTIFFGACAGVGKTFAMLQALRQQREAGCEGLVGIVETHGRQETARLLSAQAAKELANDPRYDQEMANALFGGFAAGTIGQMIDMDLAVDTPQGD